MSATDNHKKRSCRGYRRKHHTLAPKKTPMISLGKVRRRRKTGKLSSLFFRKNADS